jgi:hypothetical protein
VPQRKCAFIVFIIARHIGIIASTHLEKLVPAIYQENAVVLVMIFMLLAKQSLEGVKPVYGCHACRL